MEGSKAFAKDFMKKHQIPTAAYENFTDYAKARAYIEKVDHRVVIKASGLAAGKGVLLPETKQESLEALKEIMGDRAFGSAGDEVVIEEHLEGQELSILAFSDGYTVLPMPPAQDHKRAYDGDQGPNTGGMGCYAPTPVASAQLQKQILDTIIQPTIDGMRRDGMPFVGMLFTGIMLTSAGPKVLEYNVRFGDPETEALLPLMTEETDLAEVFLAAVEHRLDSVKLGFKSGFAATVIAASGGYPGSYAKGKEITIEQGPAGSYVFHAGTATTEQGKLVTAGGRVLAVTAVSDSVKQAVDNAYAAVGKVSFDGMMYRKDIAHRALGATSTKDAMTYASAGVSIEAGNELVNQIKALVRKTKRSGADSEIGGFGGAFDLKAAGYKDPILVSATDGVGTKLKVAQLANIHNTIGIDCVAMNVNDLVVQGAEPLFFLDYFACGKLDVQVAKDVVEGVVEGCLQAGCALIGGETAEMPGLYSGEDYDVAGFTVGAVERPSMLPRMDLMREGDVVLGVGSAGLHSNGFSLVRKIVESAGLEMSDKAPWDEKTTVGQSLLTPTRIYIKSLLPVVQKGLVKGMAHITGGGIVENVPRMLPKELGVQVDLSSWTIPAVFTWLQKQGNVPFEDIAKTWNLGIGMVIVVGEAEATEAIEMIKKSGEEVYKIGNVISRTNGSEAVQLVGSAVWA